VSTSCRPLAVRVLACAGLCLLVWVRAGRAQEPPKEQPGAVSAVTPPAPGPSPVAESGPPVAIHTKRRPGVSARAAALLLSGQQGGGIGVSALAVPVALAASGVRLFFVVDVDGSSLLAGVEGPALPVEIAVYAVNPQGGVGGSAMESFSLDVERAAEYLVGGGIKFLGSLDLPPARYTLRVLVRNVRAGTFGVIEVPRALSAGDEPFAFLSPPLVGEPANAWLLACEAGQEATLHPFPFLGEATVPSTAPVLPGGTVTRFWVIGRGLAAGTTSLAVRVLDVGGHEVAKVPAAVVARRDATVADATALQIELTLPVLAPGQYTLEVSAPSMNPDILLWASTRFLMAEKAAAGSSQVWVRFALPAAPGQGARPAVAFVGKSGRVKASPTIKAAYRSALRTLPADPASALNAVAELEAASLPTGRAAEWETLVLSETEVAHEIGGVRPDGVLALVLLHSDLRNSYALRKSYLLETHARRMVEELAVLYAEQDKSPEAKATAANALANLGGSLQQPGTMVTSERIFRRALELDPTNTAALMAVAATMERIGQYQRALQQLEALVKSQPDNAEARLRLAINVGRVTSDRRAHELLQSCVSPPSPDWIRAVASQELARSLIQAERFEQAERLLKRALTVLPGEEGLTMQLAYVLDRERLPLDAQALARDIGAAGKGVDVSPRFRYSDWPAEDLERARQALRAKTTAANQALSAALGTAGKGTAGGPS
jgi:tetratricopeptide (TPR) repeat protein